MKWLKWLCAYILKFLNSFVSVDKQLSVRHNIGFVYTRNPHACAMVFITDTGKIFLEIQPALHDEAFKIEAIFEAKGIKDDILVFYYDASYDTAVNYEAIKQGVQK